MQHTPCTPPIRARFQSFVTPSHGMLRPAARVNLRSCWTKRASATTYVGATRSGWRKPAVVSETRLQQQHRNGGAKATGRWSVHEHRCNCVTLPRRADARRSCERAFVHRKNRFFADTRAHCETRAGGVSPPWETRRRCKAQPRIRDDMRGCNLERLALASRGAGARMCGAKRLLSEKSRSPSQVRIRTTAG
jgi:hypothetical protein